MKAVTTTLVLLGAGLCAVAPAQRPPAPSGPDNGPGGARATIDLPASEHMRNTGGMGRGGPGTGAGLCVFTSVEVAAKWHGLHQIDGFQRWMTSRPGGGWPEKLADMLKQFCASKGTPVPPYVQWTGKDPRLLELAFRTRRMPAITWTPAHMLNGAYLGGSYGAIIDNNRPGVWQWFPREEFLRTHMAGNYGWCFVWLASPPPPGPDTVSPTPLPAPKTPAPAPCPGPNCPRWVSTTFADGTTVYKAFSENGKFLGVWDARGWHPAHGDGWLTQPRGEPPFPPPGRENAPPLDPPAALPVGQDPAIDWSKIPQDRPRYWVSGVEVAAEEAYRAMEAGDPDVLADDSGRYHLTVTGTDKATVSGLLGDAAGKVHLQVYTPLDWPVRYGRVQSGVTLQAPSPQGGKVLYHAASFDPTVLAEAIKYTDPNYKPGPPPAPVPQPKPNPDPRPAPAPVPCPEPCPCPAPCPCPDPCPEPTPDSSGKSLWALVLLILAMLRKR